MLLIHEIQLRLAQKAPSSTIPLYGGKKNRVSRQDGKKNDCDQIMAMLILLMKLTAEDKMPSDHRMIAENMMLTISN